jgi:hypothetical protein
VRITPRGGSGTNGLRIGCDASGIGVVQPDSPLLAVIVLPEAGEVFPLWTEAGSLAGLSLASSYSNFPNPFAPGREDTRFAFYLPKPGRVSLSLWTARGDKVRDVLDGVPLAQGLHQDTVWDGLNGDRRVVVSGAYIAQIDVAYEDGSHDRAIRKVAIVR